MDDVVRQSGSKQNDNQSAPKFPPRNIHDENRSQIFPVTEDTFSNEWALRRKALQSDLQGESLYPHEIRFLEKFEHLGHRARWIPRDTLRFKSTNDFIWINLDEEVCELKSITAKYSSIKDAIQKAVLRARDNHQVVKDFFIIDLGMKSASEKLRRQLALYNKRIRDGHIRRLWIMSNDGKDFFEINLK
ncbi:hypothetical protein J2S70_000905 [Trueperella bonasi]|uniref:tRNA nuclease CdiA C-terminal domain-containing protein n=1 Tax=Trueperella bonasi TaxID=312286 RepID=A0ABT9NH44_9ACTO|nr:hypothetical protein [Trueperella bonasi]MDP9806323.1 hypothetical protein [Trueperella bonasi]